MSQSEPQPAMESEDALAPAGVGQAASYAGRMSDKRGRKGGRHRSSVADIDNKAHTILSAPACSNRGGSAL